ncbi:hypothetical protein GCK32_021114 [Trichostrongylus colubriformis]|uniref:Uncharacterized protein n=1 Tax=Trichostrongylus colubriformis TaxID=6319 RepID=A0AAN8ER60_TRICO
MRLEKTPAWTINRESTDSTFLVVGHFSFPLQGTEQLLSHRQQSTNYRSHCL